MILTLEVIGEQAPALGAASRKAFVGIGGTIGRLPDNDWVLPDPYISGRHALIRYVNGRYFIEDTSTNGVFINSPGQRLTRSQAEPLKHGDLIYIDAYEIRVSLHSEQADVTQADPLALAKARLSGRQSPPPSQPRRPAGADEDRTVGLAPRATLEDDDDGGTQWFGLREIASADAEIDDVTEVQQRRSPPAPERPAPAPAVSAPAAPPRAQASGTAPTDPFRTLLAAAGIEGVAPSDELARTLGEVLRSSVAGVMDALRARERLKDDLHVRGTTFKPAQNNPLKFSANVADAFHNLLVKNNDAYLSPGAAFDEAFRDVRHHQAALAAAVRLAFEAMLAQFAPEKLQSEFDRQIGKGSILSGPAKLKYWELYREHYQNLGRDAQEAFRRLFGEELARAYEEQLEKQKAGERVP